MQRDDCKFTRMLYLTALLLLISGLFPGFSFSQPPGPYQVLILHSYHKGLSWTDNVIQGIEDRFKESDQPVELCHEFMDTKRLFTPAYLDRLAELYHLKYAQTRFDAIIASDDHAFNFLLAHHASLFPQTPAVFCGVNFLDEGMLAKDPLFTGVVESIDMAETLNTALSLHPRADKLVIIVDKTLTGAANEKLFNAALLKLTRPMKAVFLDNHSMQEIQDEVAQLTSRDIAIWLHFTTDRDGRFYSFGDSARLISAKSKAPLYSFWDFHLGHGIVGGLLTSGYHQGRQAAQIALRILGGESVESIPLNRQSPNRFMFDRQQLDRFHIDKGLLPPGSIIVNEPVSLYAQYNRLIWGIAGIFLFLTAIIGLLLANNVQRKKTEEDLKATRDRYRNVFDTTAVALFEEDCSCIKWEIDRLTAQGVTDLGAHLDAHPELIRQIARSVTLTDVNPAGLRLYGAASKEELIEAFPAILPTESLPAQIQLIKAIGRGDKRFECETVNRTLRGEIIHILLSITLPADPKGFRSLILSIVDITDRKLSEEALRRSEDRFRTVFNHAASGMALVDKDGNYLRVNAALCRMLDYQERELLQMNWRDVTHPEDINLTQNAIRAAISGRSTPPVEKRYLDKQGKIIWALLNIAQIAKEKDTPYYYIAQMQDISNIRAAQAKLLEREERYRQIFEADLSGFYIIDPAGEVIMCNRVFAKILGYDATTDILGKNFQEFFKDPTFRPLFVAELMREKKAEHREAEFVKKDGTTIQVVINAIGRFDERDRLYEIQGYLMDVTRQKSLEMQLLHAQKMESIGTMAGGVAHDFNNLLMGILGNASLVQTEMPEDHPCQGRLKAIEQYVQSGSDLTRQLLGFAKGGKYEVRPLDLNDLITRNIQMFARTHKNIRVQTNLSKELWAVQADHSQIDQVLYNLYVNAWQAMESGGDLTIETRNLHLSQDAVPHNLPAGRYVGIKVTDTGIGMDPEIQQRIFDPFFTTKERGRGTGLGLASAYGIIKNHAGFITVFSRKHQGSTFSIFLPASDRKAEKYDASRGGAGVKATYGAGTVLLIDDEDIVIDAVGGMLRHLGYTLYTARSGSEAIELFKSHRDRIDLVILDMIMPGMSGGTTFEQLRSIEPQLKIILCSGYSSEGQASGILRNGCQGFMQKPFTLNELSKKLDEVFQNQTAAADGRACN